MPVYFKRGNDTGEHGSENSIEPISNGEPLNQTTLRRPTEHLRARTDELRRVVTELEVTADLLRNLSVRVVMGDPAEYDYRGYVEVAGDTTTHPSRTRVSLVDSTLSISGRVVLGSELTGARIYGTDAVGDRWTNPFGYPYAVGYRMDLADNSRLLISSPAFYGSKIVVSTADLSTFYTNYIDDSAGLLGLTDPVDACLSRPGDCLALLLNRSKTPPAYSEHAEDGTAIPDQYSLEELTLGSEMSLEGVSTPVLEGSGNVLIKKLPERTFFKVGALSNGESNAALTYAGVTYPDVLSYVRARFPAENGGVQLVGEDGRIAADQSANYRLLLSIRELWANWGSHGGRGGASPVQNDDSLGDGGYSFDYLQVVRIHSPESFARHTGTPVDGRGGFEVDSRQPFRTIHPENGPAENGPSLTGLRWALSSVQSNNGVFVIEDAEVYTSEPIGAFAPGDDATSGPKKGFIYSRVNYPDHLIIPLVHFDGKGFSFTGNGGYVPLPEHSFTIDVSNAEDNSYNKIIGVQGGVSTTGQIHASGDPVFSTLRKATSWEFDKSIVPGGGRPYRSIGRFEMDALQYLTLPYKRAPRGVFVQKLLVDRRPTTITSRAGQGARYDIGKLITGNARVKKVTVTIHQLVEDSGPSRSYVRINNRYLSEVYHADQGNDNSGNPVLEELGGVFGNSGGILISSEGGVAGTYEFVPPPSEYIDADTDGANQNTGVLSNGGILTTMGYNQQTSPALSLPVLEIFTVHSNQTIDRYCGALGDGSTGVVSAVIEYFYGDS